MWTIKSTSNEGVYYLVNGWQNNMRFWEKNPIHPFKRKQDAKASLTRLLNGCMGDDYRNDKFELVGITHIDYSFMLNGKVVNDIDILISKGEAL